MSVSPDGFPEGVGGGRESEGGGKGVDGAAGTLGGGEDVRR